MNIIEYEIIFNQFITIYKISVKFEQCMIMLNSGVLSCHNI